MRHLPTNDGRSIPALGFGLYKVSDADAATAVRAGVDAGYRLIDGAAFYGNEAAVGEAIRATGMRDDLIVVSKAWGDPVNGYDATMRELEQSERDLGLGGIDLYLVHWPRPSTGRMVETWRALVDAKADARVGAIGVCNFDAAQLREIMDATGVAPILNQVESHPWLPQRDLRAFHDEHGIVTQAWSPLGRGRLLDDPTLADIARAHEASVAQVILAWHLAIGGAAVPKSTHPERLRENLAAAELTLHADDLARISELETGERTGTHPKDRA